MRGVKKPRSGIGLASYYCLAMVPPIRGLAAHESNVEKWHT